MLNSEHRLVWNISYRLNEDERLNLPILNWFMIHILQGQRKKFPAGEMARIEIIRRYCDKAKDPARDLAKMQGPRGLKHTVKERTQKIHMILVIKIRIFTFYHRKSGSISPTASN